MNAARQSQLAPTSPLAIPARHGVHRSPVMTQKRQSLTISSFSCNATHSLTRHASGDRSDQVACNSGGCLSAPRIVQLPLSPPAQSAMTRSSSEAMR